MGIAGTLVIYAVLGVCVAVALVLREERRGAHGAAVFLLALFFWPVFAPVLLGGAPASSSPEKNGRLTPRIRAAEEQLLAALGKVEGVAEEVLVPEVTRVRAVAGQLASMERRVQEMDELLRSPEFDGAAAEAVLADLLRRGVAEGDPRVLSVRARLRNTERLKEMRRRGADDLERVLLKIEEMSSQLRLLKFAGRPDAEVVQLVKEVAQSVEDVTEGLLAAG
ncbi:MAG: hypothetical protein ACOZIN_04815 [Myxococcota bacterium]